MKSLFFVICSLLSLLCVNSEVSARGVNYKVKTPSQKALKGERERIADTKASSGELVLTADRDSTLFSQTVRALRFSGFEKKLNSTTESFFVTNQGTSNVKKLTIKIIYTTDDGRAIHERTEPVSLTLPPGATKQVSLKSWDRQHSYYYFANPPARSQAIPFRVKFLPLSLTIF